MRRSRTRAERIKGMIRCIVSQESSDIELRMACKNWVQIKLKSEKIG
jgi:hypothetical protein